MYKKYWPKSIWVQALILFGGAALPGLKVLSFFGVSLDSEQWLYLLALNLILFLYVVARISSTRAKTAERRWHQMTGVLFHGDQPNISFRVETFKSMLGSLEAWIGADALQEALLEAGREASTNFGSEFPGIYDIDVRPFKRGKTWTQLSLAKKLSAWSEYDSATGWGSIDADLRGRTVTVAITHNRGLFDDDTGNSFGYFLAGYCQSVLSAIIKDHEEVNFRKYTAAEISNIVSRNGIVEFEYSWS